MTQPRDRHDYAAAVRAGDVADFCDRLIDTQLERLAWLDRKPKGREGQPKKRLPTDK